MLSLLWFGTPTFVSVIVMGQVDVFTVLFLLLSLIYVKRFYVALQKEAATSLKWLIASLIFFGISLQFKQYTLMILPLILVICYLLCITNKVSKISASLMLLISITLPTTLMFAPWVISPAGFKMMFLDRASVIQSESAWLLFLYIAPQHLPPYHNISIFLLGYFIIIYLALKDGENLSHRFETFIAYSFFVVSWFFITVYTHPQWWVYIYLLIILVTDVYYNKKYLLLIIIFNLVFMFYPMMWVNNIDRILCYYMPIIPIDDFIERTILSTTIVSLLVIWMLEIYDDYKNYLITLKYKNLSSKSS